MKHSYRSRIFAVATLATAALIGCGDDDKPETPDTPKTDAEYRAEVVAAMQTSIAVDLNNLVTAAQALQTAAPTHAWDATADAAAITAMKAAWKNTRVAYEHVEGATAPIFPDLDFTMDARYDDQIGEIGTDEGDTNFFDAEGVTGMHAIERILFSAEIRDIVVAFEVELQGYQEATFPLTDDDAVAFKTVLVQKLIDDAKSLRDQWTPAKIDIAFAFQGLVGLMNEQGEKVNLAASGEEESRYANLTMFDLRNNLAGTKTIYELFRPWIQSKPALVAADTQVQARFTALNTLYSAQTSESFPELPAGWSSDAPTAELLATPFGMLWKTVRDDVNPDVDGSIVFEMSLIADTLGFQELPE